MLSKAHIMAAVGTIIIVFAVLYAVKKNAKLQSWFG